MLGMTLSEVRGEDWAKDVTAIVDILNPDGTSFVETGTSHIERYLGNIGRLSSISTSFAINVPNDAALGQRTIRTTVRWYETGWLDLGTFGPYYAYSYTYFTVAGIKVSSPNGGEDWQQGTINSITWNNHIDDPYVKIELLRGGASSLISSSTMNDGSLDWHITQSPGTDYKIRITSTSDSSFTDTSDNNFVISAAPSITVTSPSSGENWQQGTAHTITWSETGNPGSNVKIELLKGTVANTIIGSVTDSGSYSWNIPKTQPTGSDYKIKVTSTTDSSITDTSYNFVILPPPISSTITIKAFVGGRVDIYGTSGQIGYVTGGAGSQTFAFPTGDNYKIVATPDVGYTFDKFCNAANQCVTTNPITGHISPTGNYLTFNGYFKPQAVTPSITVTSPNGGEKWKHGTVHTISWKSVGNSGANVKIELIKGTVASTIVSSVKNNGAYKWTIKSTQTPGTNYKIRITSTSNSAYKDTSNNNFIIIT
jgi:hypothetical protein